MKGKVTYLSALNTILNDALSGLLGSSLLCSTLMVQHIMQGKVFNNAFHNSKQGFKSIYCTQQIIICSRADLVDFRLHCCHVPPPTPDQVFRFNFISHSVVSLDRLLENSSILINNWLLVPLLDFGIKSLFNQWVGAKYIMPIFVSFRAQIAAPFPL